MPVVMLRVFCLTYTYPPATLDPDTCRRPWKYRVENVHVREKSHLYQYSASYRQEKEKRDNEESLPQACVVSTKPAIADHPHSPA